MDVDSDVEKGFEMFAIDGSGGGGDEFMAVKPWLGAIVAPSAPPAVTLTKPKVRLDLEWVYGYRGFDARDNVRCDGVCMNADAIQCVCVTAMLLVFPYVHSYNDADGIVYHSAGVGIVYDRSKHSQKFYMCVVQLCHQLFATF